MKYQNHIGSLSRIYKRGEGLRKNPLRVAGMDFFCNYTLSYYQLLHWWMTANISSACIVLSKYAVLKPQCVWWNGPTSPAQPRNVCTLHNQGNQQDCPWKSTSAWWSALWRACQECHLDIQGWSGWLWTTSRNWRRVCRLACKVHSIQGRMLQLMHFDTHKCNWIDNYLKWDRLLSHNTVTVVFLIYCFSN